MSELGRFLQQARAEKNISLEEVQEQTKIRKRYLEAIEQGDYSILPGQFYARAFIKSYAEAIGLHAEDVLQQFADELPQLQTTNTTETLTRKRPEVKTTSPQVSKLMSKVVLYSFIFLVLFIGYLAYVSLAETEQNETADLNQRPAVEGRYTSPAEEDETPKPKPKDTDEEQNQTEPEPKENDVELNQTAQPGVITRLEGTSKTTIYQVSNTPKMEVKLKAANGEVWYSLTNVKDKSTIETEKLPQGNERVWNLTEHEEVRFRFGNTQVVSLFVNEEPLDLSNLPQVHNILIQYKPSS